MEIALFRPSRIEPAPSRTRRAVLGATIGVAGLALAAGLFAWSPPAAWLLATGAAPAPAAPPLPTSANVESAFNDLPIPTEPADEPPRGLPAPSAAGPAAEPLAARAPILPAPPPIVPSSSAASRAIRQVSRPAATPPGTPIIPPLEPPRAGIGAPPPMREPLPLGTQLIPPLPASPAGGPPAPSPTSM
jgi:hypothetical protein